MINKNIFSVDVKKNLKDFLNPTSKNTKYYESPPNGKITSFQYGRILLQIHQLFSIFTRLNINLKNKIFLDIGTGNGMIPKLLSSFSDVKECYGIDPFLDKEHQTSWQKHDHSLLFNNIIKIIKKNKSLDFEKYRKFLKYENYTYIPSKIKIKFKKKFHYKFNKLYAHQIKKLNKKFDIIYIKSIEHFNNWEEMFKILNSNLNASGVVIIKHRSFFSYLGAHRYASTGIPWGHVLLSEKEYQKYVKKYHYDRYEQMINFYYNGLTYPRITVNELIKFASYNGFYLKFISNEPPRYYKKLRKILFKNEKIWKIISKNYSNVSAEEVLSGIYHIVLEKI